MFPEHAEDPDSLINASDAALYEATYAGRNRIVTSSAGARGADSPETPPAG